MPSQINFVTTHPEVIILLVAVMFAIMGKMMHWLYIQHRDLQGAKEKTQQSELSRLVDKIEELVKQNRLLFSKHDDTEERVTALEKKQAARDSRCEERNERFAKMFSYFEANCCGHSRKTDPPFSDRSDRSD